MRRLLLLAVAAALLAPAALANSNFPETIPLPNGWMPEGITAGEDTTIYVGTPDSSGGIDVLACNDDTRYLQAALRFDAIAGETYLIGIGAAPSYDNQAGNLEFTFDVGPLPATADVELDPAGISRRARSRSKVS